MQARDERAVCEVGRGDGQPVERSKPRVGHGDKHGIIDSQLCMPQS